MANYSDIFPTSTGGSSSTYTQSGLTFMVDAEDYPSFLSGSNVTGVLGLGCRGIGVGFPLYSATGLNGKPAFMFNGTVKYFNFGDILDNSSSASFDNIFAGTDVKFTCMIACRKTGFSSTRTILVCKYNTAAGGFTMEITDTNKVRISNRSFDDGNALTQDTVNAFYDQNIIITATFDYTLSPNLNKQTIRVNGVGQSLTTVFGQTGSGLGSNTTAQFRIGNLQASDLIPFYGAIKTVAFWNRVLTPTEITYNEGIMNTKAGGIF